MKRLRPRLLRPDRLRTLERPFGWVPFRFLSCGWLPRLGRAAKLLYFFLCLVADRRGISYYGDARLCRLLDLSAADLETAREELCCRDLLAFDGRVYQLLCLPRESATPVHGPPRRRGGDAEQVGWILRRLSQEQ